MARVDFTGDSFSEIKKTIAMRSNEGYLFANPNNEDKMVKIFQFSFPFEKQILQCKEQQTKEVQSHLNYISELEIVWGEDDAYIDNIWQGIQIDNIKGINLEYVLGDRNIPIEKKVSYLKQVGKLLEKMKSIRSKTPLKRFFYNDLHEGNFIVQTNGVIKGVDSDSIVIGRSIEFPSLYLSGLFDEKINIPVGEETDLYCYARMIINFMYGKRLWYKQDIIQYIEYLSKCGTNKLLVDCLMNLISLNSRAENPFYLLDYIPEIYKYCNYWQEEYKELRLALARND